jgi:hypothetical protein
MQVEVTRADWQKAREIYRLFSAKPNSEHIASPFSLAHVAAILRLQEVRSVLEFGAGIGTITYLILSSSEAAVHATETHPLCLRALDENLPSEYRGRLTIHSGRRPSLKGPFDLVVIDGGTDPGSAFGPGTIFFAEGDRTKARAAIEAAVAKQGLTCSFTHHCPAGFGWRRTRFGFPVPSRRKGCWIGRVGPKE